MLQAAQSPPRALTCCGLMVLVCCLRQAQAAAVAQLRWPQLHRKGAAAGSSCCCCCCWLRLLQRVQAQQSLLQPVMRQQLRRQRQLCGQRSRAGDAGAAGLLRMMIGRSRLQLLRSCKGVAPRGRAGRSADIILRPASRGRIMCRHGPGN
jgi:hypothetical protein